MDHKNSLIDYLVYSPMQKWGGEHVVSIYCDRYYTYSDYEINIKKMAAFLKESGVKNEAVIIYMDDCPACIIAFLSLIYIGAKPLIVSVKTRGDLLIQILKIAKARLLIKDPTVKVCADICVLNLSYDKHLKYEYEKGTTLHGSVSAIEDTVCYLALTSGSGGIPKIVKHGVLEMQSATDHYAKQVLKIGVNDTLLSIPKINFTYGLANNLFFSFSLGARAILYKNVLESHEISSLIYRYNVTCFFAVPSVYSKLLCKEKLKKSYFPNLRLYISAGEYLPKLLNHSWKRMTGKYIVDSVGCSETGSAYLVNFNFEDKLGSAGIPVPGYKLEFCGNDASRGMLIVSSPSNAIGYLNDERNTERKFVDGKIYTGDWFRKDEEGYYWFLGREDDMIKKNGRWISLNEIQNFVKKKKGVRNAVCFTKSNEIYVVLETDDEFEGIDNLKIDIKNSLEHYKYPGIIVEGTIPFNTNGKVDYQLLKEKYGSCE